MKLSAGQWWVFVFVGSADTLYLEKGARSEEHTSELPVTIRSRMPSSAWKKKKNNKKKKKSKKKKK